MVEIILKTLAMILAFIFIIVAAYYTTRFIAAKTSNSYKYKYFNILERIHLSKDKYLILIEINKVIFLIGVAGSNITVLHSFKSDSFEKLPEHKQENNIPFKQYLNLFINNKTKISNTFDIQDLRKRLDKIRHQG